MNEEYLWISTFVNYMYHHNGIEAYDFLIPELLFSPVQSVFILIVLIMDICLFSNFFSSDATCCFVPWSVFNFAISVFRYPSFSVSPFNHTSWIAIVTRTDPPTSVRNRYVIEVFGVVTFFCCHVGFWTFLWV